MVVKRIKEDTARRVSRTGAGSEQVLKIAVKKKKFLISVLSLAIIVTMVLFFFFYLFWVS